MVPVTKRLRARAGPVPVTKQLRPRPADNLAARGSISLAAREEVRVCSADFHRGEGGCACELAICLEWAAVRCDGPTTLPISKLLCLYS